MHDGMRDFSIYMLDPTESNSAPSTMMLADGCVRGADGASGSSTPSSSRQSQGVAVGMGLMSWALTSQEDASVTGSLVNTAMGTQALEVIFALRGVGSSFHCRSSQLSLLPHAGC